MGLDTTTHVSQLNLIIQEILKDYYFILSR